MKKTFKRYGLYSGIAMIILYIVNLLVVSLGAGYDIGEVVGYSAMVISLCFVYFGIRYYRDTQNNGLLGFGQGIKLGLLISLMPALCFGVADIIYVTLINPGFADKYEATMLQQLKASTPPAQFDAKAAALKEQMAFFKNPLGDFIVMFLTVMAIGLIITVISTFMLKRSTTKQQASALA